jgi:hypothetical protein
VWNYCFPESRVFAHYQRSPGALPGKATRWEREQHIKEFHREINQLQLRPEVGKYWDVGLLYTVLAGVLNLLVIYEAYAGPFDGSARRSAATNTSSDGGN